MTDKKESLGYIVVCPHYYSSQKAKARTHRFLLLLKDGNHVDQRLVEVQGAEHGQLATPSHVHAQVVHHVHLVQVQEVLEPHAGGDANPFCRKP